METISPTDTVWPAVSGPADVKAVAVALVGAASILMIGPTLFLHNTLRLRRTKSNSDVPKKIELIQRSDRTASPSTLVHLDQNRRSPAACGSPNWNLSPWTRSYCPGKVRATVEVCHWPGHAEIVSLGAWPLSHQVRLRVAGSTHR
jgi:hypothetical protein